MFYTTWVITKVAAENFGNMFLYKVQFEEALRPTLYQQRLDCTIYFRQKLENSDFPQFDDVHFQSNDFVNKQNCDGESKSNWSMTITAI